MPVPETRIPGETGQRAAIILALHPEGDAEGLLRKLEADPGLKLTLVFPPAYFENPTRAPLAARVAALQTARQIEIALSLDNEPNLALLADLREAGDKVQKWGFNFAWPEDAAAQTARGSGRYRKRWGQLPSGFSAPYGALSEDVMQVLRRFRLSWVLARPGEAWGVKFFGGTALVVPQALALDESAPAATAARDVAREILARPFAFVDASDFPTPDFENLLVAEIAKNRAGASAPLSTAQEFVEGLRNEFALPEGVDPFLNDHSAWVQSPLQRRAWQGLAEARQVVENYKNSGRANLTRLDAAVEEMCVAESGPFLLSLADPQNAPTFGQRNFLATLANIYRLAGVAVPQNMNNWFADRSLHRTTARTTDNDRPFFVESAQSLTWNDPKSDDNGPGEFVYPSGAYPKGSFDLRDLTVSWSENDVTFAASVANLPRAGSVAIVPLVDVYVDVNRLSGAGSASVLARRGQAVVERDAAWEYAIALTPKNAALYQGLPGGEQRLLMTRPASASGDSFSATFPRRILRGEPRQWRLTAAAGGAEATQRDEPPAPIAVQANATQKAFGGAPGPKMPPHFVDILVPSSDEQVSRLKAYAGGTVILPFVEAE
jgi:hypothetical protein